jgi:TonB-linked SusC/RagA family outer membrane protein
MKKNLYSWVNSRPTLKKLIMELKIALLLFVVTVSVAFADPSYSQKTKVSLDMQDQRLEKVMDEIENQSEFYFIFNQKQIDVNRTIDIKADNVLITDVLPVLFSGTDVNYIVMDRKILLTTEPVKEENYIAKAELQQKVVTGTVVDQNGQPLIGVTIVVKGTTIGTTTDVSGNFSLQVPDDKATLQLSYVGYTTIDVVVGSQASLKITLTESSLLMDEVVVTALGIKKESKKLGYATGSIKQEDLSHVTTNWGNALQGKVAGVNATGAVTGAAGSSKIRIRGQSSFKGDNSPLLVVNGVPVTSPNNSARGGDLEGGGNYVDGGDGWLSINPDDIESITVLKGAPAAALYGYRAKDGVLLVTTKSGRNTRGIGVEFNTNFTSDYVVDNTDFQYEYGQGEYGNRPTDQANAQTSGIWSFGDPFDGVPTMQYDGVARPYVAEKDRMKKFFDVGHTFANTLALTGGNENGNFRLSLSNSKTNGIVPNNSFDRKLINLSVDYNLSKRLSVNASMNYSNEYTANPPQLMVQSFNVSAFMYTHANSIANSTLENAYQDANGNELAISRFTPRMNPYWTMNKRFQDIYRDRFFGNVALKYQFTDWLYLQGRIGQDYYVRSDEFNQPTGTRAIASVPAGYNGSFNQGINRAREISADFILAATKKFGDIGVDVSLGGNTTRNKGDSYGTNVTNFFIRDLYTVANGQTKNPYYGYSQMRVNSLYASVELSYRSFLYLNVTGRNDWFSTLNPESNSYLYPSVTGSFVVSEAVQLPDWMSYLKLRGGYAEVGGATSPYQNNLYYSLNSQTHFGQALGSISNSTAPNPNLRPLKIKETEAGVEMRFFQNRIGIDMGIYNKNTVDEILSVDVSNSSGYSKSLVNVGKLNNKGFEMMLTGIPVQSGDLQWESSLNLTLNKSEVISLAGDQTIITVGQSDDFAGYIAHEVGMPLASLRGRGYARNDAGQIIFQADGRPSTDNIVKTWGSAIPKWIGGWSNSVSYKNIMFSAMFDWKLGHKLISSTNYNVWRHGLHKETLNGREGGVIGDGVKPDRVSANDVACEAELYYMWIRSVPHFVEEFVYDAGFVKFRQITLSYDISKYIRSTPVKGLVISAVCNNVATLVKHTPNIDPEQMGVTSDNITGLEQHALPLTRSFGVNLNVKF